jgi:pentatricopeptide repeat protein
MSSQLTRTVFRRLLRGVPIRHRGCLNRPLTRNLLHLQRIPHKTQQRSIFGFSAEFQRSRNSGRSEVRIRENLDVLLNTSRQIKQQARTLPSEDIAKAWIAFFVDSKESREAVTDYHTKAALEVWNHLHGLEDVHLPFTADDAITALGAMATVDQLQAASEIQRIYESAFGHNQRDTSNRLPSSRHESVETTPENCLDQSFADLVQRLEEFRYQQTGEHDTTSSILQLRSLAYAGYSSNAFNVLQGNPSLRQNLEAWAAVLGPSAIKIETIRNVIAGLKEYQVGIDSSLATILVVSYLRVARPNSFGASASENTTTVENIVNESVDNVLDASKIAMIALSSSHDEGLNLIRILDDKVTKICQVSADPPIGLKEWWDARLGLKAASVSDIVSIQTALAQMIEVSNLSPDGRTLACLARGALLSDNIQLAELVLSWGQNMMVSRIEANVELVFYYLANKQILPALQHYSYANHPDAGSEFPTLIMQEAEEALIQALSTSEGGLDEGLSEALLELIEKQPVGKRWNPDTLSAITLFYLRNKEYEELVELIQENMPFYTIAGRQKIVDTIIRFSFDTETNSDAQWNGFVILTAINAAVDRHIVSDYMEAFCKAGYIEEAVDAFKRMRQSSDPELQANEEVYIRALQCLGDARDLKALRTIHNYLKLDTKVDASVSLWNELIAAYTKSDQAEYAMSFWNQLPTIGHGPNEASVIAALVACRESPTGPTDTQRVWTEVLQRSMEITPAMFSAYIGALAANKKVEEAKAEIEVNVPKYDQVPALAHLLHFAGAENQVDVLGWIQSKYPNEVDAVKTSASLLEKTPQEDVTVKNMMEKIFPDKSWV